ncbi:MAG: hypothetical protein LBQ34_05160 [Alphaproteobacteria bacterium]|jgi:predicted transcriptional regulator|nr:hypothetical protein [Alphaproteobacteria bacterium]
MTQTAIKITEKNQAILQEIADSQGKTIEFVANETIENYYESLLQWQIAEIKKSQEDYRNGRIISSEEMNKLFNKYMNE